MYQNHLYLTQCINYIFLLWIIVYFTKFKPENLYRLSGVLFPSSKVKLAEIIWLYPCIALTSCIRFRYRYIKKGFDLRTKKESWKRGFWFENSKRIVKTWVFFENLKDIGSVFIHLNTTTRYYIIELLYLYFAYATHTCFFVYFFLCRNFCIISIISYALYR